MFNYHSALSQMRQRYKKIYEDFRPQFMAWKLVLLCRKLLFAIVVVMTSKVETQVLQVVAFKLQRV
jgi:hypothetical protein